MKPMMKFVGIGLLVLLAYAQAKDLRRSNKFRRNVSFLTAMQRSTQQMIFPCGNTTETGWDIEECKCPDGTIQKWDRPGQDPCFPDERPDPCWCTDGTSVSMLEFVNNFEPDNTADTNH